MKLAQWQNLQTEIVTAVGKVAKKRNITFEPNGFRYGDETCTFKILATVNDASGQKKDLARLAFLASAAEPYSSLKKEWLDKSFADRGHTYTIVGYEPSRKYSVKTKRDDGASYSWTISRITELMKDKKHKAA